MIRLLSLLMLLFAAPLAAQDYPAPLTPFVNDFADLLPEEDEAQLTAMLQGLRDSHDVEMTVVTIRSRADYGQSDTIEEFATGLFNDWGVGDATRNDGVMILVARQDREMRIELGAGYDPAWNWQAQLVIDDYFLPSFRADNYRRGILTGTAQAIDQIAIANAQGVAAPDTGGDGFGGVALVFGVFALMFGLSRRNQIGDLMMRWRRCPTCSKRGLQITRTILTPASRTATGQSQRDVFCPNCDRHDTSYHTIAQLGQRASGGSGGSFGGGSSSGGGASGRW